MRRKLMFLVAFLAFTPLVHEASVSRTELQYTTNLLLSVNPRFRNYPWRVAVVVDGRRAGGYAAIEGSRNVATVFVNPEMMQRLTLNDWAFALGHELGHFLPNRSTRMPPGPASEFEADVFGADLALRAGFDLLSAVGTMLSMPNGCSRTHGCWHSRARHLLRRLGFRARISGHTGCAPARGHFFPRSGRGRW